MQSWNAPNRSPKRKYNYDLKRALGYSFWLLSRRARTEKEIREKLALKECSSETIETVIGKLFELKFLDDLEFARNYVRRSKIIKPKGKYRLFQELIRKGVGKEIVNQAIEEGLGGEEENLAETALKSYLHKIKNLPREKQYNRAMGYLLRRGFSYDEAKKATLVILEPD
jgi:regulatory protein